MEAVITTVGSRVITPPFPLVRTCVFLYFLFLSVWSQEEPPPSPPHTAILHKGAWEPKNKKRNQIKMWGFHQPAVLGPQTQVTCWSPFPWGRLLSDLLTVVSTPILVSENLFFSWIHLLTVMCSPCVWSPEGWALTSKMAVNQLKKSMSTYWRRRNRQDAHCSCFRPR